MGRRWIGALILLAGGALLFETRRPPPPIAWLGHVDEACAVAKEKNLPVALWLYARWDVASAELEHNVFNDPRVEALIARRYVPLRVDRTDGWMYDGPVPPTEEGKEAEAAMRRFAIGGSKYGDVTILAPDCATKLDRVEYVEPSEMLERLGEHAPHWFR